MPYVKLKIPKLDIMFQIKSVSCGTFSYICVYINAFAICVMLQLYLQHGFCDVIFKIKHKLYAASGSALFTLTESRPNLTLISL
jgi:hypothetical protein